MSKIVLCVDDSATMQMVADITFRGTDFQYVGARNFDEGVAKAKSNKPGIILVDSQMPGRSGYDLCLALKNDPATADVPVVILVGNGAPFDNAKGVSVGADANLPKPWDTQTMLEKVIEIVGKGAIAKPGQAAAGAVAAAPVAAAPVAAAPAASAKSTPAAAPAMPPRSATIMGMPTIKMPAGVAPVATATATPTPKSVAMPAAPVAPPAATTTPGPTAGMRPPAAAPAREPAHTPAPAAAMPTPAAAGGIGGLHRSPMVSGTPTKRSVLVERTLAKMAARLAEAAGIEPGSPELLALLKLSTEIVERIVWEVVPDLAEQIIRENLGDLTQRRS